MADTGVQHLPDLLPTGNHSINPPPDVPGPQTLTEPSVSSRVYITASVEYPDDTVKREEDEQVIETALILMKMRRSTSDPVGFKLATTRSTPTTDKTLNTTAPATERRPQKSSHVRSLSASAKRTYRALRQLHSDLGPKWFITSTSRNQKDAITKRPQ